MGASSDGTTWTIGSCYFNNVATRWDGHAWAVVRHRRTTTGSRRHTALTPGAARGNRRAAV